MYRPPFDGHMGEGHLWQQQHLDTQDRVARAANHRMQMSSPRRQDEVRFQNSPRFWNGNNSPHNTTVFHPRPHLDYAYSTFDHLPFQDTRHLSHAAEPFVYDRPPTYSYTPQPSQAHAAPQATTNQYQHATQPPRVGHQYNGAQARDHSAPQFGDRITHNRDRYDISVVLPPRSQDQRSNQIRTIDSQPQQVPRPSYSRPPVRDYMDERTIIERDYMLAILHAMGIHPWLPQVGYLRPLRPYDPNAQGSYPAMAPWYLRFDND